nr:nesprin-1-like [Lytechinus pictus]
MESCRSVPGGPTVEIKDFGPSWRDGNAFNMLIQNIQHGLIDMQSLGGQTNLERLEQAFNLAEERLGIAKLLDPNDVDVDKPDEKSIMTYVSQFFTAYPDTGSSAKKKETEEDGDEERAVCKQLNDCLSVEEAVLATKQPATSTSLSEYQRFVEFEKEHKKSNQMMMKLIDKKKKKVFVMMTTEECDVLIERWTKVAGDYEEWRKRLENDMPGELGRLGAWLNRAEELLKKREVEPLESQDATWSQMKRRLEEHKDHFKDANSVQQSFTRIHLQGIKVDGQDIPQSMLDCMAERFIVVMETKDSHRWHLEYEEIKYRLLAFVVMAEKKLQAWTVKYGDAQEVKRLLQSYVDFVDSENFFEQYDQTFQLLEEATGIYVANLKHAEEKEVCKRFVVDMELKKKNLTVEVASVKAMLEKVTENWRSYRSEVIDLQPWLKEAERIISHGTQDNKVAFFANLNEMTPKYTALNHHGNFLVETCKPDVSQEVQQQLNLLNTKWNQVYSQGKMYMQTAEGDKIRKEFDSELSSVSSWLELSSQASKKVVPCTQEALLTNLRQLDEAIGEVSGKERSFKHLSELAQELVKSCSQQQATQILAALRHVKENLKDVK